MDHFSRPVVCEKKRRRDRLISVAEGLPTAYELAERVCGVFDCRHYEHLSFTENVA